MVTVIIGMAVEYNRTKKLSWVQIILSLIIGVGTAYLAHEWIHDTYTEQGHSTIAVSIVTIASSKGWELLMVFINSRKLSDVKKWFK